MSCWIGSAQVASAVGFVETPLRANPDIDETNASTGHGFLAWDQERSRRPGHFDMYARINGSTVRVNRRTTEGFGGGIAGHTLVFESSSGSNDDVVLYNLATGRRTGASSLNSWHGRQSHPTISGPWILFQRQRHKVTKVVLYNAKTRKLSTVARSTSLSNSVYAGQVSGNHVVWGRAGTSTWDVFLYDIAKRTNTRIIRPPGVAFLYTPAVTADGTVYYSVGGSGCGQNVRIMRRSLNGTTVQLLRLPDLHDTGYMYASRDRNGVTSLLLNQSRCLDRTHYADHPWDVYEVKNAGRVEGTPTTSPAWTTSGDRSAATGRWRSVSVGPAGPIGTP